MMHVAAVVVFKYTPVHRRYMGVFDIIRAMLGLSGSDDSEGTNVAVAREREEDEETTEADEAAGTDAPAAESAESDASVDDDGLETEAGGDEEDEESTDTDEADAADEADDGETDDAADDGETDADPVDTVSGIGPAYAERLAAAGVETVADLLDADADAVADATEISAKRITRWQESATE
jgi:predicted flap endonuclease-1-like 5' DNA nuclease